MNEESEYNENIPKKVIGVKEKTEGLSGTSIPSKIESNTFESEPVISKTSNVQSYEVINDWEQLHSKRIKGKLRTVGEYVAKQNLSKKYPTTKEIRVHLRISKEYCKKILERARRINLLAVHQKRSGHQYKYYVTNIHDHMILEEDASRPEVVEQEIDLEKNLLMPLAILDDFIERKNISFHHINLKSKLKDLSDYDRLNWRIKSDSNKGKVFELKLSQYRSCVFIVSPNGRINMIIKCSNDPLYLTALDDVVEFFSICGEIHSVLKAETSNSEPLTEDVPDWRVTQIDAAFDMPLSASEDSDQFKSSNKQKGLLSYSNFGTFRLKYLGHFYQMYSKNVLHKGEVLRLEKRFSFLDFQPTVDMFLEKIKKVQFEKTP